MYIIPAIDIRRGKVVRLLHGSAHNETIYSDAPEQIAAFWKEEGAEIIHIVDLDGAFEGKPRNLDIVRKIIADLDMAVHFGGGLRTPEDIENALAAGVRKVILGTMVFKDEAFLKNLPPAIKKNAIVSIDAKEGQVLAKGWTVPANLTVEDALERVREAGIDTVVITDIMRDGAMSGPNIPFLERVLKMTSLRIIASGGVTTLEDIKAIKAADRGNLYGIIIGKALYVRTINLQEAIKYAAAA